MPDFTPVFTELRALMIAAASGCIVAKDVPGDLILHTTRLDKNGKPEWFGAVAIKKSYVSYHLCTLHGDPALADGLSEALTWRRQGKTCFNFKGPEPALFDELAALTKRAAQAC